jgi:hypothetical protein
VNPSTFGKLLQFQVAGDVYAQPLYVSNVMIGGQPHNVLYVATEQDVVYAFDADGKALNPLWKTSFIDPTNNVTYLSVSDVGSPCCPSPDIGITGTPVIDPAAQTLYVLVRTKESGKLVQRLQALDITNGSIKNSVVVNPSVSGTGDRSYGNSSTVEFNSTRENQRSGLLLANGVVYVMWASHLDTHPYHGWVVGYDARTLQQTVVWNATPNGQGGGIWMSGGAPAADSAGNLYFSTGNGDFDPGGGNYSQAWIKMSSAGQLLSYFVPYNWSVLNGPDLDVGTAGGSLILPDQSGPSPHLLVSMDKNGTIYLLDRDNMGGHHDGDNSNIIQTICDAFPGRTDCASVRDGKESPLPNPSHLVRSSPAYWNGYVYVNSEYDSVKAFRLINGKLSDPPASHGPTITGFPGATVSISANGNSNGVVWLIDNGSNGNPGAGVLRAYDATDLSKELYNSASSRDSTNSSFIRFVIPTIANGKVYVPTSGHVTVYGLLKPSP